MARNLAGAAGYDLHVFVGVVVVISLAITAVTLMADLAVRALDPRIRCEGSRAR